MLVLSLTTYMTLDKSLDPSKDLFLHMSHGYRTWVRANELTHMKCPLYLQYSGHSHYFTDTQSFLVG